MFCAKTAPKFIETFAISTENHEFRPPNLRQKSLWSSGKAPHLVQRAFYDCTHLLCVLHVRWWLTSCRFSKICAQNPANFDRKIAQFRCRPCAQRSIFARRISPKAFGDTPHLPAIFGKLLQPLRACFAQKLRRNSSKLSRFPPKITSFDRKFCGKKHR